MEYGVWSMEYGVWTEYEICMDCSECRSQAGLQKAGVGRSLEAPGQAWQARCRHQLWTAVGRRPKPRRMLLEGRSARD